MDVATDQLDLLIERRAEKNGEKRPEEVMYAESVRAYNARRLKERRAAWYGYHLAQAERLRRRMEGLVAFHEERAQQLLQEGTST